MEIQSQAEKVAVVASINDPIRRSLFEFVSHSDQPVGRDAAAEALGMARSKFDSDPEAAKAPRPSTSTSLSKRERSTSNSSASVAKPGPAPADPRNCTAYAPEK